MLTTKGLTGHHNSHETPAEFFARLCPHTPHPVQQEFLQCESREALIGGGGRSGKSDAALMRLLRFAHVPGYSGLCLRRNYAQMIKADAIMARAIEWWRGKPGVRWDAQNHRFMFDCPGGGQSTIAFGHMESALSFYDYQGSVGHCVVFDELTHFEERQYTYLFSRQSKPVEGVLAALPLFMGATANPGGVGHCIDRGEILTPSGWRDVRDFKVGDSVYAVAPTGELVESHAEQVHAVRYTGDMMRANARGLSMSCTPDHRVAKVGGSKRVRNSKFTLTPMSELPGQATILRSVHWAGVELASFEPDVIATRKRRLKQPASISGDQYAELMGWFLSEGNTVARDRAFDISQMKAFGRGQIHDLLTRCGFIFGEHATYFRVHAPDWCEHLLQFGKCRDKFIPAALKLAVPRQLRILFDALVNGDGHWSQGKIGGSGQYYTTSLRLADDVAEVALKLGYIVNTSQRQRHNRNGLSYCVNFRSATRSGGTELLTGNHVYNVATNTKRRSYVRREPFDGTVYCIGVPDHHAFVVRQDGSAWVSGNSWVKARFVDEATRSPRAVWIRANAEDNPTIDLASYEESLQELDPVTRAQLRHGSWDELEAGDFFDQSNFVLLDDPPVHNMRLARYWDFAGSRRGPKPKDDFTASCLMGLWQEPGDVTRGIKPGSMAVVLDVTEDKWPAGEIPDRVALQAAEDGLLVAVRWEEEGGSSGAVSTERAYKPALLGFDADGIRSTGNKMERARPFAARVANRKVFVLKREWTKKWADQHHRFPAVEHDDMVDATSGAWNWLDANAIGAPRIHRAANSVTSTLTASRRLGTREQRRGRFG